LNNAKFNDRRVAVEIAQERKEKDESERGSDKRKAKWSDRRPERKSDRKKDYGHGKRSDGFKKDKKTHKKNKW